MAYKKRNFKKDQLLTAEDLNAMDDQIASNEESAKKANDDIKNKLDKSKIVQEKGNDETAVMSQAAATVEFDKLSEEIGDILSDDCNSIDLWESGSLSKDNGKVTTSTLRLRTINYLSSEVAKVYTDNQYSFCMYAYNNDGSYVGVWDGSTWGTTKYWMNEFTITENYKYKILLRQSADKAIVAEEAINIHFTNNIYNTINKNEEANAQIFNDLSEKTAAGDINNVSLWESGSLSSSGEVKSTKRIRTRDYITKNVKYIRADDGYKFYVFGYDHNGNFVGFYDGNNFSADFISPIQELNVGTLTDYNLRLVLRYVSEGEDMGVEASANIHFSNEIYTRLSKAEEDIKTIKDKAEMDMNSVDLWENGYISATQGTTGNSAVSIRTKEYVSDEVKLIVSKNDMTFGVYAYDNSGNYIGMWDGAKFAPVSGKKVYYFCPNYSDYNIKITANRFGTPNIGVTDSADISFVTDAYYDRYNKPTLTFIDDDGSLNALENWESITDEIGVKITSALVTGVMGDGETNQPKESWEGVARLQNKGYEFVSHTHNHINIATSTNEKVETQFKESISALREHGCESRYIVYPYNSITDV